MTIDPTARYMASLCARALIATVATLQGYAAELEQLLGVKR